MDRLADWRVFAAAALVAAAADSALRAPQLGLAATLLVVACSVALLVSGRVGRVQTVAMLAAAVLAVCFTVRRSLWLVIPDAVVATLLLGGAAGLSRTSSLLDLPLTEALASAARTVASVAAAPWFAVRSALPLVKRLGGGERRAHTTAIARSLPLAILVAAGLGVVLARSDPIFASYFQLQGDPRDLIGHMPGLLAGAWLLFGLCRAASASVELKVPTVPWPLHRTEALVVLSAVDLVFCAFVAIQAVATADGQDASRAYGLTYAEYARLGFFKLLWIAGIALVVLLGLRSVVAKVEGARRGWLLLIGEVAIICTVVLAGVAFLRLTFYESAYGFTLLRLYGQVVAAWIVAVYLALALALTPLGRGRHWFMAAMAGTGVIGLLALNLVNPEALITRLNLAQAQTTHQLDVAYLTTLSDDAVPEVVSALPELEATDALAVRSHLCSGDRSLDAGWNGFNLSSKTAQATARSVCR